jgi:16S rRNA (guanine527-N7)-methyltransferase
LKEGAAQAGLDLASPEYQKLLAFLSLMSKWNAVYNLTAVRDPEQMLVQHLLDSLAIIAPLNRHIDLSGAPIADIGSGAGLPGLPLAIVFPTAKVLSIEPVGKKVAFQRQSCAELALTNVEVFGGRAQALTRQVDLVICRAFASMADFVDAASGLIGPSTLLAAMKGQIFESPRGPMFIDAQTRDVVQNIYLRRVERKEGQLHNVEFDVVKHVKDPGKAR